MLGSSDTPQEMQTSQRAQPGQVTNVTSGQTLTVPDSGFGAFSNADLKTLLGEIVRGSLEGRQNPYVQVGQSSDVSQINPRSQDLFQSAMGFGQLAQPGDAALGRDAIPYRPESAAQGAAAQLRDLFAGERPSWISGMVKEAADQTANIYSSGNALYSGAARNTITDRAYEAADKAMTGHVGALGKILQGGLNVGATVSQPEYFNPSYVQNPFFISPMQAYMLDKGGEASAFGNITGGLSSAASLATTLATAGLI